MEFKTINQQPFLPPLALDGLDVGLGMGTGFLAMVGLL